MNIATITSVILGFAAVYWVFSTICSYLVEVIASFRNWRGQEWRRTLSNALSGEQTHRFVATVLQHPIIKAQRVPTVPKLPFIPRFRGTLPSYVPAELVTRSLIDSILERVVPNPKEVVTKLKSLVPGSSAVLDGALDTFHTRLWDQSIDELADLRAFRVRWSRTTPLSQIRRVIRSLSTRNGRISIFAPSSKLPVSTPPRAALLFWRPLGKDRAIEVLAFKAVDPGFHRTTAGFVKAAAGQWPRQLLQIPRDDGPDLVKGLRNWRMSMALAEAERAALADFRNAIESAAKTDPALSNALQRIDPFRKPPLSFASLQQAVVSVGLPKHLETTLTALLEASGRDLQKAFTEFDKWYDAAMARATGYYKRLSMVALGVVGFVVAALFNLDAVSVGKSLIENAEARSAWEKVATAIESNPEKAGEWIQRSGAAMLAGAKTSLINSDASYEEIEQKGLAGQLRTEAYGYRATVLANPAFLPASLTIDGSKDIGKLDDAAYAAANLLARACSMSLGIKSLGADGKADNQQWKRCSEVFLRQVVLSALKTEECEDARCFGDEGELDEVRRLIGITVSNDSVDREALVKAVAATAEAARPAETTAGETDPAPPTTETPAGRDAPTVLNALFWSDPQIVWNPELASRLIALQRAVAENITSKAEALAATEASTEASAKAKKAEETSAAASEELVAVRTELQNEVETTYGKIAPDVLAAVDTFDFVGPVWANQEHPLAQAGSAWETRRREAFEEKRVPTGIATIIGDWWPFKIVTFIGDSLTFIPIGIAAFMGKLLAAIPGWLLSGFLVSLGAPFFYDLISRITNLRGVGPAQPPASS